MIETLPRITHQKDAPTGECQWRALAEQEPKRSLYKSQRMREAT